MKIFLSDGSKCDCDTSSTSSAAKQDRDYRSGLSGLRRHQCDGWSTGPAKADGSYEGIVYLPCTRKIILFRSRHKEHVDLVYLCFPNNPTGAVASRPAVRRMGEVPRASTKRFCS